MSYMGSYEPSTWQQLLPMTEIQM